MLGNEIGQVLICVLTEGEGKWTGFPGVPDLWIATAELEKLLLLTAAKKDVKARQQQCYSKWDQLVVRMDVWHFMRRIALGVTTDSHPLYGPFLNRFVPGSFS